MVDDVLPRRITSSLPLRPVVERTVDCVEPVRPPVTTRTDELRVPVLPVRVAVEP